MNTEKLTTTSSKNEGRATPVLVHTLNRRLILAIVAAAAVCLGTASLLLTEQLRDDGARPLAATHSNHALSSNRTTDIDLPATQTFSDRGVASLRQGERPQRPPGEGVPVFCLHGEGQPWGSGEALRRLHGQLQRGAAEHLTDHLPLCGRIRETSLSGIAERRQ